MKELLRKKSVKISLLLILLLIVMGIVGINVRSSQKDKEYKAHIAAAEKYLSDLDYEQAIAEYTKALEIDPKEEVVDALEQTYLAYAQTCIDAEDYEKAVSILEEGYEMTGRKSIQNKMAELQIIQEEMRIQEAQLQAQKQLEEEQRRIEEEQRASGMVEFPFQMTDITVMGSGLFGDYFAQLKEQIFADSVERYEWNSNAGRMPDGWFFNIVESFSMPGPGWINMCNHGEGMGYCWSYEVIYGSDGPYVHLDLMHTFDYEGINVPVKVGETYEDWCRVMRVDRIKENNLRPEERDGIVGIWKDDVCICDVASVASKEGEYWFFSTEWYQGIYNERDSESGDGYRYCEFFFSQSDTDVAREKWPIHLIYVTINADRVIESVSYTGWPTAE